MIREFHIGAGHTFSPAPYESYKVEASLTVTVNDGDDYGEAVTKAQETLRELLRDTYSKQQRTKQK